MVDFVVNIQAFKLVYRTCSIIYSANNKQTGLKISMQSDSLG